MQATKATSYLTAVIVLLAAVNIVLAAVLVAPVFNVGYVAYQTQRLALRTIDILGEVSVDAFHDVVSLTQTLITEFVYFMLH